MPYKVRIDPRDTCISDMVCVSICGEVFEMNDEDGKSQIKPEFRTDPNNLAEGIIPDDLYECAKEAEESCPVNIIHVEPA